MIVGLGNPGGEYRGTRHNVGFDAVDRLAERHRIRLDRARHHARIGQGTIGGVSVLLVKPLTYMNLSGRSVAPLAREHGLKPERILVVADDLDLEVGRVRIKPKGSAGGHNGHKSLIAALGTTEYPRIKIGIGAAGGSTVEHVLGGFRPEERRVVDEAIDRAAEGCEIAVERGLVDAMNAINPPA
jgi:peptidyl-tRNA hydrolase, PTH1 family